MSWHFSQALVAAYSAASCSGGEPSAPWNSAPTAPDDSCSDKMKGTCHRSPFGTMYAPSTDAHGEALLRWYRADSLARTSARLTPWEPPASTASAAVYGEKWRGSFARFNHATCSWRTPQCSLLEGSDEFSETWPRWGFMRNGECWALPTPILTTAENGSGWLPTPQASDGPKWYRVRRDSAMRRVSDGRQEMLIHAVARLKGYPEWSVYVANPRFWEAMMDWPIGWTNCAPLEMDRFREWLRSHGTCSGPARKAA